MKGFLLFPFCALFGHQALGLMSRRWSYSRDVVECACGAREHTGTWLVRERGRRV